MKSKVMHIGKDAISTNERILVLFGENATEAIRDVSILQAFEEEVSAFVFHINDEVHFGDQIYTVSYVGENVGANLVELGHVTFVFDEFDPEHFIETSVYLTPHQLPKIELGMMIQYVSKKQ
ncbi:MULTISPECIES: PTS glucitol/sorbitol transporter subunit IIA [unclassified Jeotgalibaca]|uniref:PTS glucitol/sorbitol transporter subunit IIA n=1 Tax=unclassified Jeotgalibaca TaxID=2621505 RepID=UPI003FD2F183